MGGGGGKTKTNQTTTQSIDPTLQPLFGQTGSMVQGIQAGMPDFGQFFNPNVQQIPGLTQGQQNVLGQYGARAFGNPFNAYDTAGANYAQTQANFNSPEVNAFNTAPTLGNLNAPENAALGQIDRFTSGEIGQSPATQAAMAAVRNPVLNDLAMAGLGNSDALSSSLGGAYAPILAQEMSIRAGAIPQLAGIGAQQRGGALAGAQLQSQLGQALRGGQQFAGQFLGQQGQQYDARTGQRLDTYNAAEEKGRQILQQQGEAAYKDFVRRQQLGSEFTTGILSGFPSITGTNVVGQQKGGGK